MPDNKNAFERLMVMDEMLRREAGATTSEIREALKKRQIDVDLRTIQLDLKYIKEKLNKKIIKNGTRCSYDPKETPIFTSELSSDEKKLLQGLFSILGKQDEYGFFPGFDNMKRQMEAEGKLDAPLISFDVNPQNKNDYLLRLYKFINEQKVIQFSYKSFNDPKVTLTLHPYLLKEYNRRWFLFANRDIGSKEPEFKVCALDRIESLPVVVPDRKFIPYRGNIFDHFKDVVGVTVYPEKVVQHIIFWVSNVSHNYVRTKPIHHSQKLIKGSEEKALRKQYPYFSDKGGKFFSIDCKENRELFRELISYGRDLFVLEPQSIRDEMSQWVSDLYNGYQALREDEK